jgi:two-component system, response regulator RegA
VTTRITRGADALVRRALERVASGDLLGALATWRSAMERGATPEIVARARPTLARVEWEHISRVLADCGGNVSRAARALGIHRRSLQRKLAKYPAPR